MVAKSVAPSRCVRNAAQPPSEQPRTPNASFNSPMNCHAKRLECVQLAGAVVRRGAVRKREQAPHPYPKSVLLNIRGRLASLLSLLIGNRGSPRYVGVRRLRWVWAWLAHCPLYHTNTCNTRNPSAKTCAPGCPSPALAQNPANMATRRLACSSVSLAVEAYLAVSFFLRPIPPTRRVCRTVRRVNPGALCLSA